MFVLALTTDFWTAFGSVATGVAAALAAGSLLLSWRQRRAAEAATIRQRLRALTDPVRRIATLLGDGAAVIDAAWRTAAFLREQAGPGATVEDVVRVVREGGVARTASVEGWAAATAAGELREALAELSAVEQGLSGELSLFSGAAELLRRIIGNTYSPVMFHQLLDEEALAIFVGRTTNEDVDEFTRALAGHLHGSTLTYYRFRYDGVPASIKSFVETASSAFADLDAGALVKASRAKVPVDRSDTLTGDISAGLKRLRGRLPDHVLDGLVDDIRGVERTISLEAAREAAAAGAKS